MPKPAGKYILITRPTADADEFARDVGALGLVPFIEPMLGIMAMDYPPPDFTTFKAIIFTSANAVRVFGCPASGREALVFAVGAHTAEEARKQGYARVFSAEGDGSDLAALVKKKLDGGVGKLLHIRGEHTAVPLGDIMARDKIGLQSLVVYTAKTESDLTPACRDALKNGDIKAVTFFSRRTAGNFMKLVQKEGLIQTLAHINALCISPSVLECVQGVSWLGAYSSERPDRAAMLNLLRAVCLTDNGKV